MQTKLIAASLILIGAALAASGADNTLGTWNLNVAKSKYTPAPMPVKSLTLAREAADGGVKQTINGVRADGTAANASYTAKYDGKEVQVAGNAPYDTIAIKQVNANTLTDERTKTGTPYKASARTVVSHGGKIMTVTASGTNANGKHFKQTFVFDKQ